MVSRAEKAGGTDQDAGSPDHQEALDALRHVGNVGSHEGRQDFTTLIDCFEILELALEDLIDTRRTRLSETARKLVEAKGKGVSAPTLS
ncbi:DUF4145 domain-containing protein [Rhizobium sp. T1470]|uniref:DUF4145 domain-containing protein n=1 Tax=Rhizobium sp. T1470 TaxID=555320 RepID=UPI0035D0A0ED